MDAFSYRPEVVATLAIVGIPPRMLTVSAICERTYQTTLMMRESTVFDHDTPAGIPSPRLSRLIYP